MARGTPEGQEVEEIMREGKLVPAVSGYLPCSLMIHIIVRVECDSDPMKDLLCATLRG